METTHNSAPRPRVFVVEDSRPIRERLEDMIVQAGAEVAGHAAGVATAIEGILAQRPELVILDLQLADGTGFDVLRAVREVAPEIDFYVLTNNAVDPYRQLASRLGASGIFDKSREFNCMRDVVAQRVAVRTGCSRSAVANSS